MGFHKSKIVTSSILVFFVLASGVNCQAEEDYETTQAPDDEEVATTVEPLLSTTTLAPLRELDFRMVK
jgi:hypothetical protein